MREGGIAAQFTAMNARSARDLTGDNIVISTAPSNITAPTRYATVGDNTYAYRQFGSGPGLPLLFLQHFTGTLDSWDPAVTDPLAAGRSVILFESAGVGRS